MASTIKTRSSLYLQGLQDGYSNEELADFCEYVLDNTSCLPRSRFSQEQAQVVSKFLFFANDGRPFEEPEVWRPIHDVKLIDSWLRSLQKAGCSPSTLYNRVRALKIASRFTYATFKMEPSSGLREDLDSKLSVFNRRRKAAVGAHEGNPLPDLKALQEDVFDNESAKKRFQQVVRRAQGFQDVDAKLQRAEFLFAMRMALVLCQSSVGTRPSALYTLTTSQVIGQDGRQQRSGHHRARVSFEKGPARLCHLCQVEMPKCSSWRPCLRECQRPPSDTQPGQRKPGTPSAKLRMGSTPSYLHGLQKGSRHRASHSRAPKKGTGYARWCLPHNDSLQGNVR